MIITCRRAVTLMTHELDLALPVHKRAALGFHTLLCGACRRFRQQMGAMDELVGDYFAERTIGDPRAALPPSTKDHLKVLISSRLTEDS